MTKKLLINDTSLDQIKEFALRRFHDTKAFKNMDYPQVNAFLILAGLEDYLYSKGIDPPFELKLKE
jgi:hypothetical protein